MPTKSPNALFFGWIALALAPNADATAATAASTIRYLRSIDTPTWQSQPWGYRRLLELRLLRTRNIAATFSFRCDSSMEGNVMLA
jgi:hypothetical protein